MSIVKDCGMRKKIKVQMIIYSNLNKFVENYDQENGIVKEVTNGKSILQFIKENISYNQAINAISVIIVNDQFVPFKQLNRRLEEGDIIKLYPPIGGG